MKKIKFIGLAALCVSPAALSATLNFAIPTSGFVLQSFVNVGGSAWSQTTDGNITVEGGVASALLDVNSEDLDILVTSGNGLGNPYFDAQSGGNPGGLGNCRNLTASAQCNPSNDDNLGILTGEAVRLDFKNDSGAEQLTKLGEFTFRDDDHNLFDGTVVVRTADGLITGLTALTVSAGTADLSGLGAISWIQFTSLADVNGTQSVVGDAGYYISGATASAVPVPAAAWLFGSGLIGLAGLGRKRAQK